jgi:glutaredoxin 3
MEHVVVYSTRTCAWCRQAERFLAARGIPFTTIDVTGNDAERRKLVELSGGMRTVPQIFIGNRAIGGYTDLVALDRAGGLEPLLSGASAHDSG